MPIFTLNDVSFDSIKSNDGLLDGKYSYDILRYPIDLGSADKGHYMVIHINAQKATQVTDRRVGSDAPTIYDNRIQTGNLGIGGAIGQIIPGANVADDFYVGFLRTIYRTTDTIALYMPDTLAFTQNQQYSDLSLSGMITAGLSAAAATVDDWKNSSDLSGYMRNLSPFVALAASGNPMFTALYAAVTGSVVNPMLEVIYTSPEFRVFRFDFMFYPRSSKEAEEVQNIIERIRFHQSPEIKKDSFGFFLIPPSEFDIKFYYNGKENPNIPKISTCILTGLDIDYAPQGFAAYEVPKQESPTKGGTGMPVGIRLSLNFKETEYLVKDNYKQV